MSEYDTSALLEDIKERGSLPDEDMRFTDALLLSAATREMREGIGGVISLATASSGSTGSNSPIANGR